jgi:hypothetical protein
MERYKGKKIKNTEILIDAYRKTSESAISIDFYCCYD